MIFIGCMVLSRLASAINLVSRSFLTSGFTYERERERQIKCRTAFDTRNRQTPISGKILATCKKKSALWTFELREKTPYVVITNTSQTRHCWLNRLRAFLRLATRDDHLWATREGGSRVLGYACGIPGRLGMHPTYSTISHKDQMSNGRSERQPLEPLG
jgi:hypothetical protein